MAPFHGRMHSEARTNVGAWRSAKREFKRYEVSRQLLHKYSSHAKEHQMAIEVPAIANRTIWDAAGQVMKKHWRGGRDPKQEYLLSGTLRCVKNHVNMHGQRREDAEREQHLGLKAMAGPKQEIARYEAQKAELLDVSLNRGKGGKLITC